MPPRIPRLAIGRPSIFGLPIPAQNQRICPICSLSRASPRPSKRPRTVQLGQLRIRSRNQSTGSSISAADILSPRISSDPRKALRDTLADLQQDAASFVNISRLQLAIRGLEQEAGQETIRIGILGLADGGNSVKRAEELLRLLVVDPLKTEEEWERILRDDQQGKPILVKVGHNGTDEIGGRLVQELQVSSPLLNGHKLELLVLEMDPSGELDRFTDAVMVPTMEIPTSNTGRYTPVTTPVHKSLIVADGLLGAATLLGYSSDIDREIIGTAVNLQIGTPEEKAALPVRTVDVKLGAEALDTFRQSVDKALDYEKSWFASGIPEIQEWIKSGTAPTDGATKPPVLNLIESLLRNAIQAIDAEQSRRLSAALAAKVSSSDLQDLRQEMSQWAERAHTELRDQLDIAFDGQRWRKLGWWKLFWRVDDVSMISTEILQQRFLTEAEKEIIFLCGRIAETGIADELNSQTTSKNWAYKSVVEKDVEATLGSEPPPPVLKDLVEPRDHLPAKTKIRPWPLHIPATRDYLAQETVPALQALAQKLVLQTLSTSSLASAFAGLMYVSSVSTGLYECGAVAALGIVWSLRRMQGKWETAREFWEGEVREEGRKAVRGVEGVIGDALVTSPPQLQGDAELQKAREAVERAEIALAASK
ncbi:hypothetical protein N431DRAFT_489347 [Stipitochalara longipes BDJ]|nr:hypothetical protein N431DRAFT_489347 [Stipitochalara longipes BDJ]